LPKYVPHDHILTFHKELNVTVLAGEWMMSHKIKRLTKVATLIWVSLAASASPSAAASDWTQQVTSIVRANFSYPRSAEIRREQGKAIVRLALTSDGTISNAQLAQSSGSAILDREAMRIAERIGHLPSPPKGTSQIMLPIVWRLED
jgi:protein TonB